MNKKEMLDKIPKLPGIYVFKDLDNNIIYIGKAKNLYKRVSSYFKNAQDDWKVNELVKEYKTIEHILTKNEIEALLLEAQLIKKFKPKYNVLLKSGTPFIYILITSQEIPQIKLVNSKKNKGTYFGPFLYKQKARIVYEYLMRNLKLRLCSGKIEQGCLDYHLGRCAGNCLKTFNLEDYKIRINISKEILAGNYKSTQDLIKEQIKTYNKNLEFEKSKHLNEYLKNLEIIFMTLKTGFTEKKYTSDITAITTELKHKIQKPMVALEELQTILNLNQKPKSIDCFDISHFQSSYIVGSCIRFTYGIPDKNNFRRFKIKSLTEQNDYAALQEIVTRRYKDPKDIPDIILIDGGKGQLNSVKNLFNNAIFISLAKKEELLFIPNNSEPIKLDLKTEFGQLLIAIRDYAHHFAISYHKLLRNKNLV